MNIQCILYSHWGVDWTGLKIYKKLEAQWTEPVSLTCHFALRTLYSEPSIGTSYKFQIIWPNGFREDFLYWPITNKNDLPSTILMEIKVLSWGQQKCFGYITKKLKFDWTWNKHMFHHNQAIIHKTLSDMVHFNFSSEEVPVL